MNKLDDTYPVEVAPGIWWVGFADYEAGFSNNPYLLVDGDQAVLFDPGPGHPAFRDIIMQKIRQVINPEQIRYLVVHHQDPDLCGLIPFIENILHPSVIIIAHPRTSLMLPYYGLRKGVLPVGDGDRLQLNSGRCIKFYHAPYVHFAGNMMSYDESTASLLSSDIFAVFNRNWSLYADELYLPLVRSFLEHYIGSKAALLYVYERLKALNIARILPQHGGIIEGSDNVQRFVDILPDVEPGRLLRELRNRPSAAQEAALLETGRAWMQTWLLRDIEANSLDVLMQIAMQHDQRTVSLLMEVVAKKAYELGVANPMTYGRIHYADRIENVENFQVLEAIRRRFLSRQYGMLQGVLGEAEDVLQYGLLSFKAKLGVMFVDIRNFTEWSADRSSGEVVLALNRQHELVSKIINARGGRVNKIMGDGLLAYFPENHLDNCVQVAIDIQRAIDENDLLRAGIGCDFGVVTMGDIGEQARLDYTLIGAPVNFASRMCDAARPGEIVITCQLDAQLSPDVQANVRNFASFEAVAVQVKENDPELHGFRFAVIEDKDLD